MFAEFAVSFSEYLNNAGYSVTPDKVSNMLACVSGSGVDVTDTEEALSLIRVFFCTSRQESDDISEHFRVFFQEQQEMEAKKKAEENIGKAMSEKQAEEQSYQAKKERLSEQIRSLEEKKKKIEEKVRSEWQAPEVKKTKPQLAAADKYLSGDGSQVVKEVLARSGEGKSCFPQSIQKAREVLVKETKEAMLKRDLKKAAELKKLFDLLSKVKKAQDNEEPMRQAAVKEATKESDEQIRKIEQERMAAKKEHELAQRRLDEFMAKMRSETVSKPSSVNHRKEFKYGTNAVQAYLPYIDMPKIADKEFKYLTESEKTELLRYIRENILKFKTRLSRRLYDTSHGKVDMCRTIQSACRTGGLPMTIEKEQRKPGKSNLVLLLDVSGSCKEASVMMLSFIHLLKEVFPKGCKAFAFVNSLYDITPVMEMEEIEAAVKGTLEMIPRAGQYSNYEKPIRQMWEDYRAKINKESMVIMIGDARNNKNGSAEEEFKNISRKAKSVYWLNTDTFEKWDTGDSIASTYAKYSAMMETRNVRSLITFISDVLK